ncbi:MAG: hypothetical protein IIA83_03835 [Thaumarchaeota archaeon]|nr:hypothetical protein [Nitrososphaerota archaeon]
MSSLKLFQSTAILFTIFALFFPTATFAIGLSTDKSYYSYGDPLTVTGQVDTVEEGQFIVLQIINPTQSDIVIADQFLPTSQGFFSRTYPLEGPKLNLDGTYTLKIFYGEWFESTFQFKTQVTSDPSSESSSNPTTSSESTTGAKPQFEEESKKKSILGFIDPNKDPQYYIDRYYNEPNYKEWFDRNYPDYTIEEAVGLESKSKLPEWVRNIFIWYAENKISEDELIGAFQFLIKEGIIKV